MSDAPPISEYELRIVDVLRRRSYERIVLGAVVEEASVPRRLVRHHLGRLVSLRVVERAEADNSRIAAAAVAVGRTGGPSACCATAGSRSGSGR
ncbi:MAG: hypothetical protein M5U31_16295 [Acidimicrobiia bacterium]|nr:hypothetical protein [Acidimicrobiia bacterium]